jgi:hypothetical protein
MIDGLGGLSGLSLFCARVSQKRKIKVKKAKAHKSTKTNSLDGTAIAVAASAGIGHWVPPARGSDWHQLEEKGGRGAGEKIREVTNPRARRRVWNFVRGRADWLTPEPGNRKLFPLETPRKPP